MSITELFCAALEAALNRYLAVDPTSTQRLQSIHGKVIALELVGIGETLYLIPGPGRLQLLSNYEGSPDCRLRGTPLALSQMGGKRASSERLFSGQVEITGDTELGHSFAKILAAVDVDWEEQLSHATGDIIAHGIGNLWRGASSWSKNSSDSLALKLDHGRMR